MYGSLFIGGPLQLYVEQKQTAEQIQIQLLEFLQRLAFEIKWSSGKQFAVWYYILGYLSRYKGPDWL